MSAVLTGETFVRRVSALDVGVATSVALHAVLLFAVAGAQDVIRWEPVLPGPLVARLVAAEPVVEPAKPAPKAEQPRRSAPPVEVKKPEPAPALTEAIVSEPEPVVPQPKPAVLARSEPAPSEQEPARVVASAPASVDPRPSPVEPQASKTRTEAQGLALARPQEPPAPRIEQLDPKTVAQYRGALISAARRYKIYPRVAIDNNWEGKVQVRMVVGATGSIASLQVTASAGYEVLDAQALEMIRRAWPEAQLPANLRGREFAVDVPVIFSLRDPSA